jgi:serine/threonine-protein kinase HipA
MRARVHLAWSEPDIAVGELTTLQGTSYFQYAADWPDHGTTLDPLVEFAPTPRVIPRGRRTPLLGIFGDSIPDGWGLKVLHARARQRGRAAESLQPEELLCMVGNDGPGALTYAPAVDDDGRGMSVELESLFGEAIALHRGGEAEVAEALGRAAGASGGARPKVSLTLLADGSAVAGSSARAPETQSYLVKFPTDDDGADYGSVELAYAAMARAAGIDMPPTRAFDLFGGRVRCFGVERFDRPRQGLRPHVASLAAILQADFREEFTSYETYLRVGYRLEPTQATVTELYRRMVFNVLACVRDDHMKNFAFRLDPAGRWSVAPAYDLVPLLDREHATTVRGKAVAIARADVRSVLTSVLSVPARTLSEIEAQVAEGVSRWPHAAVEWGVTPSRVREVQRALDGAWREFAL